AGLSIDLHNDRVQEGPQARRIAKLAVNLSALLADRRGPAMGSFARLHLPFKEMADQDNEPACQFATGAAAHTARLYCASRTVARALRPLASITVRRVKPGSDGCQKIGCRGSAGGSGRPSTSQRKGRLPPVASSGRLAPSQATTAPSGG